ncbi:hypothetical protein [Granulicella mallensis]|uniref:Uncharacterized protein n=1 Tax=Granulicella mallensis (strain ATCC BAA-1857 / DSM 23137 / MP5ACTX8) TaxID=682795 RepID=G8NW32_GRAMM|nr:hypothetical protein [Granulicella mallensis]AEU35452.1 hypothetical protein AciX8_1107 [Granulicella mallensis MP5ACTX8]
MKYEEFKEEIKAIAEIADSVPQSFKERCFEVLLQNLLASTPSTATAALPPVQQPPADTNDVKPPVGVNGTIPTPSQVKVLMQKTGLTQEDLSAVLMYEDQSVLFVHEPQTTKVARGQVEWALLLALKNGIESNVLSADPEKIRSVCQEKGFYDKANFIKNFKGTTTAGYFTGAMEAQGEAQKLTTEGMKELAKVVKDLSAAS